jgi:hypothetical protein
MYDSRELEFGNEQEFGNEFGQEFGQEYGNEFGQEYGNEFGQEFNQEFNMEFLNEFQGEQEYQGELPESRELELANELLSISNEQELNQFLGKIGRAVGNFARSSAGKMIGKALKSVAKKALPWAAGALGTFVGGPVGGAIGSKLGTMATKLFELELEGLSPEDREFEVARAYVRFASDALRRGAAIARSNPSAQANQIVRTALKQSASQYAPGLLNKAAGMGRGQNGSGMLAGTGSRVNGNGFPRGSKGSWVRRGRAIVLYEV